MSKSSKKRHHSSGQHSVLAPQGKSQKTVTEYFDNIIEDTDMPDTITPGTSDGRDAGSQEERNDNTLTKLLKELEERIGQKLKDQESRIIKEIEKSLNSSLEYLHNSITEKKDEN